MEQIRCKNPNCRKVLLEAQIKEGVLIKICPRCKTRNIYEFPKPMSEIKQPAR